MKIKLGYVSISKTLNDVTPSTNVTYTSYQNGKADLFKIDEVIRSNLDDLEKIIDYNIKNNIHFYRLTSKLIPLATIDDIKFDYINPYIKRYNRLADKIINNNMRVDVHPDQFTVLNSTSMEVRENTLKILQYHASILQAMNIENPCILLHVGSNVFGKESSLKRFITQFLNLPKFIQDMIAIENDDKVFTLEDVIYLSKKLHIPVVLDYHHFLCNHEMDDIEIFLDDIIHSWNGRVPKMHFSSPKSRLKKEFRSHHDYIDGDAFIAFLEKIQTKVDRVDIMLEAKAKDEALFRLVRYLKYKTNYHFIDETTFKVDA